MRFSVAEPQKGAAYGHEQTLEEATEGVVFPSSFIELAREKAEQAVAEGKEIQNGKGIAQNGVIVIDPTEKDEDERKHEKEMVDGVGTVSAHKEAR